MTTSEWQAKCDDRIAEMKATVVGLLKAEGYTIAKLERYSAEHGIGPEDAWLIVEQL